MEITLTCAITFVRIVGDVLVSLTSPLCMMHLFVRRKTAIYQNFTTIALHIHHFEFCCFCF